MKLEPEQKVSMKDAKERALAYLKTQPCYVKASSVAQKIWPDHRMTSQGAGAAASRVLKALEKDGLVKWSGGQSDWGWESLRR